MSKKDNTKLINGAIDAGLAITSPFGYLIKKGVELVIDSVDGEDNSKERVASWLTFIGDLGECSLSDRTALMFLPSDDVYQIWENIDPIDSEIVYLDRKARLPERIKINGDIKNGILYVADPRDIYKYYPVDQIQHVLLKDHLLEMKNVFERLGATFIDITFCGEDDENTSIEHNDSESLSVNYNAHSGSISHVGNHKKTSDIKKYYQLEIHKECAGKCLDIDFNKCY